MSSFDLTRRLDVGREAWTRFGRHWEGLAPDPYAAELGVQRLRRYGHYVLRDGVLRLLPNDAFVQPDDSNPRYIGRNRDFEPLTDAFARDPLLHGIAQLLSRVAAGLDDAAEWHVKVHPFRVLSVAGGDGRPTPEGLHRDGVTLVSSLMIQRRNAIGGESTVCDNHGRHLLTTTLDEPGTLLLGDDRRTLHAVSPIRPIDNSGPAQRDVLVITFASGPS
ncbi:2OG-Fe dioxygenase family protein [Mycobacterium simiae]|uniref:2OG-Fe dioxygenase family protein n=1 Tax=Mycobacterium simiae TaxID=1784 RepID=A0A5B1BQL4_MYCSI|nr:2OG-Fe dioxygenase family protein [Mycobacterium simiae]KAA1249730.1 2OG-Fe dioxygenase family protein [Mycobacterium simiae]